MGAWAMLRLQADKQAARIGWILSTSPGGRRQQAFARIFPSAEM